MARLTFTYSIACAPDGGALTVTGAAYDGNAISGDFTYALTGSSGTLTGGPLPVPFTITGLADDAYSLVLSNDIPADSDAEPIAIACGLAALVLDSISHTDETAAGAANGEATITASGGIAPLTASLSGGPTSRPDQPAVSGQPTTFAALAPGTYLLTETDSATPPASVSGTVTIAAYTAPVVGCMDEYADNYNPDATTAGSCTYLSPLLRSAWQFMEVRVPAVPGQQQAFIEADLLIGFRPGHPLAATRPYGDPVRLRATVGPSGTAVFRLGPYLRPQLGAPDGHGGRRLDLNSPTAFTEDVFVGYELRRTTGELLEHGYALNAAIPDKALVGTLTPCTIANCLVPVWSGYESYEIPSFTTAGALQQFAVVKALVAADFNIIEMPCPPNPLPVRWLSPEGGYGFWVFQHRPQLGDDVGDGQGFVEAETNERRWSERGAARRTVTASSGVFAGAELMEMLRTLWRSPQVWYQPVADGPWVAVTLESGSFPAGRIGVRRQEVTLTFTEGASQFVQGQ